MKAYLQTKIIYLYRKCVQTNIIYCILCQYLNGSIFLKIKMRATKLTLNSKLWTIGIMWVKLRGPLKYLALGCVQVIYQQDCKNCGKACFPYCVQPLRCSRCGETDCVCSQDGDEDDNSQERHVDPNKPHRGDLCHRCRAGKRCTF